MFVLTEFGVLKDKIKVSASSSRRTVDGNQGLVRPRFSGRRSRSKQTPPKPSTTVTKAAAVPNRTTWSCLAVCTSARGVRFRSFGTCRCRRSGRPPFESCSLCVARGTMVTKVARGLPSDVAKRRFPKHGPSSRLHTLLTSPAKNLAGGRRKGG